MQNFESPTSGRLSRAEMLMEIAQFVGEDPKSFYRLVIGSDSHNYRVNSHFECDFVTAIVIHRVGHGARYFWQREKVVKPFVLRDKIYAETMRSLKTAQRLVPALRDVVEPSKYELEIHIDVGAHGPTREMIKEVVGMVTGNGYVAKTKPQSWAASSVADRYT